MKKQETSFWEGFLAIFCVGIIALWLFEEEKRNKKRIQEIRQRLNSGPQVDKYMIDGDWKSVGSDLRSSYQNLTKQKTLHETQQAF